ncbi:hypothetical protein CL617_02325 [archaeon]|nr:hypothetical protein [archaeon]
MQSKEYDVLRGEVNELDPSVDIPTREEISVYYKRWGDFMKDMGLPSRKKILDMLNDVREGLLDDLSM